MSSEEQKKIQRKQQIVKIIKSLLPDWKDYQTEDVKATRMTGITNETYKIEHPSVDQALLFREFGDADDNIFINRESESFIYQYVSNHNMGPKILGATEDVRLQSFIESSPLKSEQMLQREYIENIAYTLKRFHSLKPTQKVPKESLFYQAYFSEGSPILHKTLNKMKKPIFNEAEQIKLKELSKWVTNQQIQFLKEVTKDFEASHFVFSHNDLLAGNVLIRKKDKKVIFIDYEYSCFNYPIYDIANYFAESRFDYSYPEEPFFKVNQPQQNYEETINLFIQCYIVAEGKPYHEYKETVAKEISLTASQGETLERLKKHLDLGFMLCNIMWGWWAIVVSKNENINFDYISFAMERHRMYQIYKKKVIESQNKN